MTISRCWRWAFAPALFAAGLLLLPETALAQGGPGSGDELPDDRKVPRLRTRVYKFNTARRAQQRRLEELKRRIAVLREAVPRLLQKGMHRAAILGRARARFESQQRAFRTRWLSFWRRLGKRPGPLYSSYFSRFGAYRVWSSDTTDWKKAKIRKNVADGDNFYLYSLLDLPKSFVRKRQYAVLWSIRGYDFEGREKWFFSEYRSRYGIVRWPRTTFRRRFSGLGLSPGWYEAEVRVKIRRYYRVLYRRYYGAFKVSQASPLISAPPATRYRKKDANIIDISRVTIRSRGAKRGEFNPKKFLVRGRFKVDSKLVDPDKNILIGGYVYRAGPTGQVAKNRWQRDTKPVRTAFRFRQALKRATGSFGSKYVTGVKELDVGLVAGKYVLRVWGLVTQPYRSGTRTYFRTYWSYSDHPFSVAKGPVPPKPGRVVR